MFVGLSSLARARRGLEAVYQSPRLVFVIIALGIVLRLVWLALRGMIESAMGEAFNTAVAFAQTGTLADAFKPGQGPTAHLTPLPPLIAGTVYRVLGVGSFASELTLLAWTLGLTVVASLFFFRAFEAAGTPRPALLLGLAGFWLLPINFHLEVVMFRIWEGTLATALAAFFVYRVVRADRKREVGWGEVALLSLVAAVLFLVSPPLGLAGYAAALLLTVRTQPMRRWIGMAAVAAVALAAVVTPWAVRNQQVMGSFIPLRSNLGLELAVANHPAAARGGDDRQIFLARMQEVHPYTSRSAYHRFRQAGGEVAYAEALGREAKAWMADHPLDVARLSAKHVLQFFFPPRWFYFINDSSSQAVGLRQAILWALSLFGLAGVVLVLARRRRPFDYLIIMVLVPVLPYAITQPILRYRYITYAPMMFFASIAALAALAATVRMLKRDPVLDESALDYEDSDSRKLRQG
jgi:hypothetical protein